MRWKTANEALSAELAITSLISNKREWSNCFIKFLKLKKIGSTKYARKKREHPNESEKKNLMEMRCCVILDCQTEAGLSEKHFLPFCVLLNVGIDLNFSQKKVFLVYSEKFRFPAKKFLA